MKEVTVFTDDDAVVTVTGTEYGRDEEQADPVLGYRMARRARYGRNRTRLSNAAAALEALEADWPTLTAQERQDRLAADLIPAVRLLAVGLRWVGDLITDEVSDGEGPAEPTT